MIADWEVNGVFLADMLKIRHPDLFGQLHSTLTSHGVEVRLLNDVCDIWARDYSPIQVGPGKLVKFQYDPDYLRNEPELRTGDDVVKSFRDLGNCRLSPIILDAGNVVASRSKAILTDKIYKENPGWRRADLRDNLRRLLDVDQLIIVPKEPYDPIGHVDAMVRFIDEKTVLVNNYTRVHADFGERLLAVLRRHRLVIETIPYFHEDRAIAGIPSAAGCYANFLHTEGVIVAPAFGAKEDPAALRKLKAVFPRMPVIPIDCTNLAREGGVLNCIAASFRRAK